MLFLYKGVEHLWILVSKERSWNQTFMDTRGKLDVFLFEAKLRNELVCDGFQVLYLWDPESLLSSLLGPAFTSCGAFFLSSHTKYYTTSALPSNMLYLLFK
jgi:hypothetical protein